MKPFFGGLLGERLPYQGDAGFFKMPPQKNIPEKHVFSDLQADISLNL